MLRIGRVVACALGLLVPAALLAQDAVPDRAGAADAAGARAVSDAARLYDTSLLHRIDIVLADEDAGRIVYRATDRVRCTITIDGITLKDVGVRQSGGVYHPYLPITAKPSLSLKFDEFTKGQRVYGLDKLILKNELQDYSFVSEHLTYEIFRRAGLAAPMTAHARVSINGLDSGIYLMREPIDKAFLRRNFGGAFDEGNLYEIENTRDFVFDPSYPKLDHEGVDGRNRDDLMSFAAAVRSATPDTVERDLAPYLDIDRFATFVAAEIATGHWDGVTGNNNNTYIYANPKDGRFVFLPWGADQAFRLSTRRAFAGFGGNTGVGALGSTRSYLVRQLLGSRRFADRVAAEVERIGREPVWNQQALTDRLNAVERILTTAEQEGRTGGDVNRFRAYRATLEAVIRSGG